MHEPLLSVLLLLCVGEVCGIGCNFFLKEDVQATKENRNNLSERRACEGCVHDRCLCDTVSVPVLCTVLGLHRPVARMVFTVQEQHGKDDC